MKLEYLSNYSSEYHDASLVRLYDFDSTEAKKFADLIGRQLLEEKRKIELNEIDFIEAINCTLSLVIGGEDLGIEESDSNQFVCVLTQTAYRKILDLIQPFIIKSSRGYQWLYDIDTPIEFLFSPAGTW